MPYAFLGLETRKWLLLCLGLPKFLNPHSWPLRISYDIICFHLHTMPEVKEFLFFLNLFYLATSADGLKKLFSFFSFFGWGWHSLEAFYFLSGSITLNNAIIFFLSIYNCEGFEVILSTVSARNGTLFPKSGEIKLTDLQHRNVVANFISLENNLFFHWLMAKHLINLHSCIQGALTLFNFQFLHYRWEN